MASSNQGQRKSRINPVAPTPTDPKNSLARERRPHMIGRTPAKKIALQIEYAQGKHDGLCICQTDLWPSTGRYADIPCMTSCWCMCASCWSSEHQKCICKHCPCKVFHADTTFDLEMIARRSGAGGQAARQTANRLFVIS